MIKGTYFSKFLKLCLFGCGISCIMGLGNSVNAVSYHGFVLNGLGYTENNVDSQFSNSVLKRGKFLTQFLGITKPLFGLDNNTFVFWYGNKLYLFDKLTYDCTHSSRDVLIQGYFNSFRSCPEITTGEVFDLDNCGERIDYNEQLISNFLSKVNAGDWFFYYQFYNAEGNCRGFGYDFSICYSSSELHKTLCFDVHHTAEGSDISPHPYEGLGESLGLASSTTFGDINTSYLGDPPGWGTATPETIYGSGQICPSVSQMLSQYDKKYTTGYCYVPVYDSGTVTNYFIEDIFSGFSNFQDMYSNYFAYCHAPVTEEYCNSMLGNNMLGKSFIYKLSVSPYDFDLQTLWNYCHLTTLPPNATSCVLSGGGIAEPATPEQLENAFVDMPSSLVVPGENTIVSNVLGTGATDLSNIDIIDTLNGLYSRFTSFFTEQSGYGGALPTYIITFLLVIILFKLFKK